MDLGFPKPFWLKLVSAAFDRDVPSMGSDANPGKPCLIETTNHWKYMLTLLQNDRLEAGDYEKLEKAVQQTYDWIDKNQRAKKDEFYAEERKLMHLGERILDRIRDDPEALGIRIRS